LLISFSSAPGKLYRVERSLVTPVGAWNVVADNIAGTGANVQVTDAGGNLNPSCFYQVVVLP
jgi:hypothetical protein